MVFNEIFFKLPSPVVNEEKNATQRDTDKRKHPGN